MHKSYLTEADHEDMQRLQAIAARPAERARLRGQGLLSTARGMPVRHPVRQEDYEIDCGDRQERERLPRLAASK